MAINSGGRRVLMSQINVTPFVDVMLVLLIIFMVTAPMMQSGIDVNLPKVTSSAVNTKTEPLIVTIDRRQRTYLGDTRLSSTRLRKKLRAINKMKPGSMVLLKADRRVPYGYVVKIISQIRGSGITKIGMITESASKKR
jgi:biopolymer transport protein TolR